VRAALAADGIATLVPAPVTGAPARAAAVAAALVWLPLHTGMGDADVRRVVGALVRGLGG
jgi:dTDP-4-amino-4,6-dideoxygalactose transaminase